MLSRLLASTERPEVAVVDQTPTFLTMTLLAMGASAGIATYGGAIHAAAGPQALAGGALRALFCAGGAWALAIPALVVLGALTGSPVSWRRAVFGSLLAVNFGGMAFLASIPVVLLLDVASPWDWTHAFVNVLCVLGVGGSATLIFLRTMAALEGPRVLHHVWMLVFGTLFLELAWLVDLFRFH